MSLILDGTAGVTYPTGSGTQGAQSKVLQVVQAVLKTNTSTTGSTFVTSTITASITPLFATSKILVTINTFASTSAAGVSCAASIYRNGSAVSASSLGQAYINSGAGATALTMTINYLDSPASTSAQTYTLYFKNADSAGTASIGSGNMDSTITLTEVAA